MSSVRDKLRVFVSSRLVECREERTVAQKAILSLNHEPILFEHLGARPYSPRRLYSARLMDSQIMIAIYRSGYGFIDEANGMEISGIADEYQIAIKSGIPIFVYVYGVSDNRDPKLQRLIDLAATTVTFYCYYDPNELLERIRDDLTTEITNNFIDAELHRGVLRETPIELLVKSGRNGVGVITRIRVLEELSGLVRSSSFFCIHGPAGIGKTTLAAQLATAMNAEFVRATNLAPKDLFAVCASALVHDEQRVQGYATLQGARLGFAAAWAKVPTALLVVDECDFVGELVSAVNDAGGASESKKIVFTSRDALGGMPGFEIPSLTSTEAIEIISSRGGDVETSIFRIITNPLELRLALVGVDECIAAASPVGREIVFYLAICNESLSVDALLILLGDEDASIETLYKQLEGLFHLVEDSPRGFRLLHAELAARIRDNLTRTPQRLQFYAHRLIRHYAQIGNPRLSYNIGFALGDGTADKYAVPAIRQAARLGDWIFGVRVTKLLLENAINAGQRLEALSLMLELVYPLELTGNATGAADMLSTARGMARDLGPDAISSVEYVELASRARRTLSESDVLGLEDIRRRYRELGDRWNEARLGLELSAVYMSAKSYATAIAVLRPTLPAFVELGDAHGIDLSERNLASALSADLGNDREVELLVRRITSRAAQVEDGRRQRAWMCNLLTRRYRRSGRYVEAETVTREALELGDSLGDETIRAIALVNLGNIYKDQKRVADAVESYEAARAVAKECGRSDIEADSYRLQAVVFNDIDASAELVPNRREEAKRCAQRAIELLDGTVYYEARARSYVELGEAHETSGSHLAASIAYFHAARDFRRYRDAESEGIALIRGSRYLIKDFPHQYIRELAKTFSAELDLSHNLAGQFLILFPQLLIQSPKGALITLLSRHLLEVYSLVSPVSKIALMESVIDAMGSDDLSPAFKEQPWRLLYAELAAVVLFQAQPMPFLQSRLAKIATKHVNGLNVRETGDGDRAWTIALSLRANVVVTVESLDAALASTVAAHSLAMFAKAFEGSLSALVEPPKMSEVAITIISYDAMEDDMKKMTASMAGNKEMFRDYDVLVTRPVKFTSNSPTFLVLGPDFLSHVIGGPGECGALQELFVKAIIELVFQLLLGEVDQDDIRPKVISLVRGTMI